jgi:hypothetical protein
MSQLFGSSPPPRRRLRKFAWTFLILIGCAAAFVGWAAYQSNVKLREAMAEAAMDVPHWQLPELETRRADIPPSENSALVIQNGHRLIAGNKYSQQQQEWEEAIDELTHCPTARANEQQIEALNSSMKPFAAAMVEFDKLKDLPRGRYPLKISEDIVSTLLPHTQNARTVARTLRFASLQRIEAGNVAGAADALVGGFNAGRSVGEEPFLISYLVRVACDAIGLATCERFLAQTEADDATLARVQAIIELELSESMFLNSLRGERALGFGYLEYLKSNPSKAQSIGIVAAPNSGTLIEQWLVYVPGMITRYQIDALKNMNQAVRIAHLPYEEYPDNFADWEKKVKNLSGLARMLLPSVVKVSQAAVRHQAQLRCMQVAVAAERYRLQFKKWPEKLDELVDAKFIKAVPLDPFDGKPLRWKVVDEGRLVYSVGQDRIDNGGNIDRDAMFKDGGDIGYRLYNVDKRRQPPRPVKAKASDGNPGPGSQ